MFSKTWLISMISSMVLQYAPLLDGHTPTVVALLTGIAPAWLDPLILVVVPAVISWFVTILLTWARNDAVKSSTLASPLLGTKSNMKKLWKDVH